jgi:hypothetical protein
METQKSSGKQGPIFPHLEIDTTIQKCKKNVKSKSFLKKKSYGIPLLRRSFLKTGFASKRKKLRENQGPIFPHLEISITIAKTEKNVKSKSFLNEKRYGFPLLRMQKSKTGFARKRKKLRENQGPIFPHLEIFPAIQKFKKM